MNIEQTTLAKAQKQEISPMIAKQQTQPTGIFGEAYEKYEKLSAVSDSGSLHMEDATYGKPQKEEETLVEQMQDNLEVSAADRKNQMVVLSNTTSEEDYKQMQEEGFSLSETDSKTLITVLDKIKATLAKAGVDVAGGLDSISQEELERILGSEAIATQVAQTLQEFDLPVDSNMADMKSGLSLATKIGPMNEKAIAFLVKNQLQPTLQNFYKAQHSSQEMATDMGAIDFKGLEEQMTRILTEAGYEPDAGNMELAKWMVQQGIPLNKNTLDYVEGLQEFQMQEIVLPELLASMAEAILEGNSATDAVVLKGFSLEDQAEEAFRVIHTVTMKELSYVVKQQLPVTVANLKAAQVEQKSEEVDETDSRFVTARRQLEETRLMMTLQASRMLIQKGIQIDTKPLENLVEDLKAMEQEYYREILQQNGLEGTNEEVTLFQTTTETVVEMKTQPAYVLTQVEPQDTISTIYETGKALKDTYQKAGQTYEALMTAPRADLGDSIIKAFRNVDDILVDLDMELTEANRRAVRILGYNSTEITQEQVEVMRAADQQMQRLFKNLTPAATLELIRRGENPLDMSPEELNMILEEINASNPDNENERFNRFLWKMERSHQITVDERTSYIGIYRLVTQIEKNDGAVIGALVNQGAELTMRNLIMGLRSQKKAGHEYQEAYSQSKTPRIDDQIATAYQKSCMKDIAESLTPDNVAKLLEGDWQQMTIEQVKDLLESTPDTQEEAYVKEQLEQYTQVLSASEEVYSYLEHYDIPNTMNNVLAVAEMMRNANQMFKTLWKTKGDAKTNVEMVQELQEQVLELFGEAVKTPEDMAEAQETLAEVAEHAMQSMIIEGETVSAKDLRDLAMMNRQFGLCGQTAKEESYMVPVLVGDEVTGVSLKIVRGEKKKGLVDIFFRGELMGKVAASFEAKEDRISGMIAVSDEETRKLISENLSRLAEFLQEEDAEPVDLRVALIPDLSLEHYQKRSLEKTSLNTEDNEEKPVQTKRLYQIAESFLKTVTEITGGL